MNNVIIFRASSCNHSKIRDYIRNNPWDDFSICMGDNFSEANKKLRGLVSKIKGVKLTSESNVGNSGFPGSWYFEGGEQSNLIDNSFWTPPMFYSIFIAKPCNNPIEQFVRVEIFRNHNEFKSREFEIRRHPPIVLPFHPEHLPH